MSAVPMLSAVLLSITWHLLLQAALTISWTVACQSSLSMGFSRQEYWSGLPFPLPGDLPDPGIEPMLPTWQANSSPPSHQGSLFLN